MYMVIDSFREATLFIFDYKVKSAGSIVAVSVVTESKPRASNELKAKPNGFQPNLVLRKIFFQQPSLCTRAYTEKAQDPACTPQINHALLLLRIILHITVLHAKDRHPEDGPWLRTLAINS